MSLLETFMLPALVTPDRLTSFVVKESLTRYPLFGAVMRAVEPIVVQRANAREDLKTVLTEGERKLREEERSVLIFPQSTRSVAFQPRTFNSMAAKLARRAGVPLVPLALKTDFHGIGKRFRDLGRIDRSKVVHFAFGPPIHVTGTGKGAHKQTVRFIGACLREWGGEVADETPPDGGN
jgi:1-acyl-sn-glycerol-3-phosphate acyltransferase